MGNYCFVFFTNGGHYTKHIYAGTQRIASKLGDIDAFGADPRRVATAGHEVDNAEPIDFAEKYSKQNSSLSARYDSLKVKTKPKENNDYVNGKSFCCSGNSIDEIEKNNTQTAENAKIEDNLYFYHPDHLRSTNLITNFDGEVTQSVAYVPYGEVFVEERNGSWATPFLFNAKELDEETGLYYYGARYLNPVDCRWLSPDPMQGKYPGMTPYNYCAGNPVKLVDPDGRVFTKKNGTTDEDFNLIVENIDKIIEMGGEIGRMMKALKESKNEVPVYRVDRVSDNGFDPNTNELSWCPDCALVSDNGCILPPIALLGHEGRYGYDKNITPGIYGDLAIANSKYFQQYDVLDALEDNAVDSEKEILQMMGLYPSGLNPDRTRNECYGSNKNYKVTSPTSICPMIEMQYIDIPQPTEKITEIKPIPKFINPDVQSNKKGRKK